MTPERAHNPKEKPFLTSRWLGLVMAQWPVPAELLQPCLPRGLELDPFRGPHYVSLVGLQFEGTRVLGVRVPFHADFTEVNLRFYVRREHQGELRRGVVFIREYVPRFWISLIARALYNERYSSVPMSEEVSASPERSRWKYSWRVGGARHSVEAIASGPPQPMLPGSREEFVAEHYWGYTRQRDGSTHEYRVRHAPWRVWSPERAAVTLDWEPAKSYGDAWAEALRLPPEFAFVAEGSGVSVSRGGTLPAG